MDREARSRVFRTFLGIKAATAQRAAASARSARRRVSPPKPALPVAIPTLSRIDVEGLRLPYMRLGRARHQPRGPSHE